MDSGALRLVLPDGDGSGKMLAALPSVSGHGPPTSQRCSSVPIFPAGRVVWCIIGGLRSDTRSGRNHDATSLTLERLV